MNNWFLKKERCVSQIRITLSQILEDEWQRIRRKRESRRKSERERGRGRVGDREKHKEEVKREEEDEEGFVQGYFQRGSFSGQLGETSQRSVLGGRLEWRPMKLLKSIYAGPFAGERTPGHSRRWPEKELIRRRKNPFAGERTHRGPWGPGPGPIGV